MTDPTPARRLYRSRDDRMLAGICGGLAEYFNLDPKHVRIATVVLGLLSGGSGVIAYIVLMFVIPERGT